MNIEKKNIIWSIVSIIFLIRIFLFIYEKDLNNSFLRVSFLDVGQGDSIFIESPNGVQVLVDAGANSRVIKELGGVMRFYDRSIDILIPTHEDKDHIGGFPEILKRFDVDFVLDTSTFSETNISKSFDFYIEEEDSNIDVADYSKTIILDENKGVYLRVLFPDQNVSDFAKNEGSTTVQIVFGDTEFLLTGDLGSEMEDYLVYRYRRHLESEVLKAGHHGSNTSSGKNFLDIVEPQHIVISAGENNRYGHPHKEVFERLLNTGAQVYETSKVGTITFLSDGKKVWVDR